MVIDGYHATPKFTSSLSFQLSQGLDGLSNDLDSSEFPSNPDGDNNFTSALLNLSHTQRFFDIGTLVTLKGGSIKFDSLPAPEAFTYGYSQFGRAFKGVYLLGDQG